MIVKGITIHNTGSELSARELYDILKKSGKMNLCHFLVDEKEVIEVVPLFQEAYHTGKGYDFGNQHTIAIEVCRSRSNLDLYVRAEKRAIILIKKLLREYQLASPNIYFHKTFNVTKKCPHRILEIYGTLEKFVKENNL